MVIWYWYESEVINTEEIFKCVWLEGHDGEKLLAFPEPGPGTGLSGKKPSKDRAHSVALIWLSQDPEKDQELLCSLFVPEAIYTQMPGS